MTFKIGQHIVHENLREPRNIRSMRYDSKGVLWLGTGRRTAGWLKASDCKRWSKKAMQGEAV